MTACRHTPLVGTLLMAVGVAVAGCDATADRNPFANAQEVGIHVLVAARDLPKGTLLRQEHLHWQPWPERPVPGDYLVQGTFRQDSLHGSALRQGVATGRPIVTDQIIKPGERGFLAAVLRPGHRAHAIDIRAASAITGGVFPGDRIDLILTHKVNKKWQVSETILKNLRILAIDQSFDDQSKKPGTGTTVTVEVTPKQAEILAVASGLGELSFGSGGLSQAFRRDEEAIILKRYWNPNLLMEPFRGTPLTECAGIPAIPVGRRLEQDHLKSPCGNILPLGPDYPVD